LITIDTDTPSVRINASGTGSTKVKHRGLLGKLHETIGQAPDPPVARISFHNQGDRAVITIANSKKSGGNPLVPGAPVIDYSYTVVIDFCERKGRVFGFHTAYP
jgi:hypothetical protein